MSAKFKVSLKNLPVSSSLYSNWTFSSIFPNLILLLSLSIPMKLAVESRFKLPIKFIYPVYLRLLKLNVNLY